MIKVPLHHGKFAASFVGHGVWMVGAVLCLFLTTSFGWSAERQVLHGHVPKAVPQLRALRRLETTNVLQLAIGLPLRNQGELTNLLQDLYNPASPNYRHFLTADEFAKRFGPTEPDYQAVMEFAKTNGFKVVGTHPNRMLLDVAGAVSDIERTFHLTMRVYQHPAEAREFYAPDAEPQLDLATPVLHISGLDNFLVPQPLCREMSASTASAQTATPAAGSGPSGNYAGKDFRAAYAPGVTNTGAGQAVGLLEFQGYYASDITTYEANYSLPNIPLNNVLLGGLTSITADAGDAECPLDIEMAISMATNLSQVIIYCTTRSGNTDDILNRMATDNLCKQLSASWLIGADATGLQIYQQFAAQGQSFFNASGDSDAASAAVPIAEDAPYITTVGGTTLVTTGAGGSRVSESTWNRGNGTGSTGGISPTYGIPLWQQGINMNTNQGSAFMRNVPDVACVAENVWVLYNNGGSGAFGGTSCAAPLWAGFTALANQQAVATGRPLVGFINPTIYAIGKSASYTSDFHDITTGNNTLPSSPNRFYAFPGYDLCTGWGTPSGQNLINALVLGMGDTLMVTPANGLTMAGPVGGPFVPASGTFSLANFAGTTNRWSLSNTSAWFTVSPGSGAVLSGASANVTVTVAAAANSLPAGFYSASLLFTNLTTSVVQSRPLTLVVGTGMTWDSSAAGGAPQDGPGIWADQSSVNGNTNWWTGTGDVLWTNASVEIATFGANSGAADVVTLGSAVTAAGINFTPPGSGNYTIAGGGNTLTLNGNVIASTSATISAPVTLGLPATFSVTGAQTLTVSSVIAGGVSDNLAINGPGTVSLTGQNNTSPSDGMAGNVVVNSGTLSLNSSSLYGTLGNVSGITIGSGATLSLQGVNAISGSNGTARNVTLNSGGSMTNAGSGNHAIGLLTLNGGTLTGAGSPTAGSFNLTGDVFVYANSTISAQNLTTASGMAFKVANAQTLTLSGTLIGTGGLTCNGSGTVIVVTNNTYSGGTTINYGTLQLLNAGGLGSGSASVTVGSGGQLQIYTGMTGTQPLTLNGYGPVADGALRISSGANVTWTGPITLGSPSTINLDSGTALAISSTIGGSYSLTLAGGSGSQGVAGGAISIGASSISKSGAGAWILSGTNTFTGALNVDTGSSTANDGILRIASPFAVPSGVASVQILNNNSGTSTLQLDGTAGNITLPPAVALNGRTASTVSIENLAGTNTVSGGITVNVGGNFYVIQSDAGLLNLGGTISSAATGTRTLTFQGAGNLNISGVVSNGSATVNVSQLGAGTLTLSGANTFTGTNRITAGSEVLANGSALQSCFVEMNGADSGTLNFGTLTSALFGALTGTRDLWLTNAGGAAVTLTAGNNNQDATYGGALSGPGSLTKTGSGAFTLSGANAYTGATTVNAGKLFVNGSTSTGPVTATGGGTLGGNGVVNGPVAIQSGGVLAPGANAIGQLIISNTLTLSGATVIELNKTGLINDSISGLTSVAYGGSLVLTNLAGTLTSGDSFKIFTANSYGGAFAALVPAAPGPGLGWNTNTLASDGKLRVITSGVAAPTSLAAAPAFGVINLSWTQSATPSVTQNNIYRSTTGSGGPFSLLTNVPASVAYADTTVVNGSTYYYAVTAINANGESVFSSIAGATAGGTPPSVLPYTVDAATLHLWHFDGAGTITTDEVQTAGITLTNLPQPASPGSTITLGNAAYNSYFHSCLHIIATNFNLGNCWAFASNSVGSSTGTTSFCNATNGTFTFEAMVKMDGAPTNGNGNWEIICGDNPSNVAGVRGWQFRINSGSAGTTTPRLEFNSINTSSGTMGDFFAFLPATGANAWATGQWYHAALTYTGTNGATPGVLGFYWTLVNSNTTAANLITNFSGLTGVIGGNPILAVGGSARNNNGNANGEGFKGSIDEVRISSVARSATNMIFHLVVVNGTWVVDADGNWSDASKWSGGLFAVGPGSVADFSTLDITAPRTVTLDSSRTVGTLLFGDVAGSNNWTLASSGGSVLTLDSGSTTPPSIVVNQNTATITAALAGTNGFAKSGSGTLVLATVNTYTNATTVSGGMLLVNGSISTGPVAVTTGMLGGTGTINGPTTIQSGGILAPGVFGIGTLTFGSGLTLAAGSTNVMELNKTALTNDQLNVAGTLNFGGNLVVTNLSGTLAAGDSFKLFNAGGYSGLFANVSLPPLVFGLAWQINTLTTDGIIRIAATNSPVVSSFVLSGNSFRLSATGGPPGSPYRVLMSTNLTLPLTNWTPVWTDTFDLSGSGQFTNPFSPSTPQQFFNLVVP